MFTHALARLLAIDRSRSCGCASVLLVAAVLIWAFDLCERSATTSSTSGPLNAFEVSERVKDLERSNRHLEAGLRRPALEAGRRCSFRSRNLRGLPAGDQPKTSKRMQLLAIYRDSEPVCSLAQPSLCRPRPRKEALARLLCEAARGSHVHACGAGAWRCS